MSTRINDLSPANQQLFLELLTEVLRELEVDFYDVCVFASAVGSNKALTPEDFKNLHDMARRFHGLARLVNNDDR
jgi:hypothetical protein